MSDCPTWALTSPSPRPTCPLGAMGRGSRLRVARSPKDGLSGRRLFPRGDDHRNVAVGERRQRGTDARMLIRAKAAFGDDDHVAPPGGERVWCLLRLVARPRLVGCSVRG